VFLLNGPPIARAGAKCRKLGLKIGLLVSVGREEKRFLKEKIATLF
jgi:hypothetical protein